MKRSLSIGVSVGMLILVVSGCAPMGAAPSFEPVRAPISLEAGEDASAPAPPGGQAGLASSYSLTTERMVIRTANLDLIVPDTEQALERIQSLAEELGGYVVSLNTYQYEQGVQGSVTIRIPAESLDTALERVKELATTVRLESISGQDVTEEYVDLESRLRNLEAVEAQLLEFLDEAEDTEATLAVYEQLSATQEEIEIVTGRMQYLEDQAALSTITVNLTPDALAEPLEIGGWNLPGTVRGAIEALLGILEFFVKALIVFFITVLPALVLFAAPIVGLVLLIRWLVRLRRKRRAT